MSARSERLVQQEAERQEALERLRGEYPYPQAPGQTKRAYDGMISQKYEAEKKAEGVKHANDARAAAAAARAEAQKSSQPPEASTDQPKRKWTADAVMPRSSAERRR